MCAGVYICWSRGALYTLVLNALLQPLDGVRIATPIVRVAAAKDRGCAR